MDRYDTDNLIDLEDSPHVSGTPTPFSSIQPPTPTLRSHVEALPGTSSQPNPRRSQSSPPPPPLQHASTSSASSSGYGIGSAVWGLFRRISTVDHQASSAPAPPPGTSQLYHQNAAYSNGSVPPPGAGGDGINGAFTPPRRTATPRGLPSLEPLHLRGYRDDTESDERLLARGIAEEIRTFLPERLKIMEDWRLVYSLYQHGSSLATLYQQCEMYRGVRAGFILVVRDGKDGVCYGSSLAFSSVI
jgi:hypothetical protein